MPLEGFTTRTFSSPLWREHISNCWLHCNYDPQSYGQIPKGPIIMHPSFLIILFGYTSITPLTQNYCLAFIARSHTKEFYNQNESFRDQSFSAVVGRLFQRSASSQALLTQTFKRYHTKEFINSVCDLGIKLLLPSQCMYICRFLQLCQWWEKAITLEGFCVVNSSPHDPSGKPAQAASTTSTNVHCHHSAQFNVKEVHLLAHAV